MTFADRRSAGHTLAKELAARTYVRPVVFALPRGGVPIGVEVAKAVSAPLDLLLVRKIGVPGHEELAAGSIVDGEQPDLILNDDIVRHARMSREAIAAAAQHELAEIERRRALYMPGVKPSSANGATAILVDDGVATGASMKAALAAIRRRSPARVVVAAPVAAPEVAAELARLADEVVLLATPDPFGAVSLYYDDFHQIEDAEVSALLAEASASP